MSRSSDGGATWTPPGAFSADAATDSASDVWPQLATDGAGHWVAVWWSDDSLGGSVGTDYGIHFSTAWGPDTDGDGLSDSAETKLHSTDPLVASYNFV